MTYILIGLSLTFFSYLEGLKKTSLFSKKSAVFFLLLLLAFTSLRFEVGTDWPAYYYVYHNTEESAVFDIGYATINNAFSNMSVNYNLFLAIINAVSLYLIFTFLKKNTYVLIIGILIYFSDTFLYYNFSGIRQAIAISLTCVSINFSISRQYIRFFSTVLIASSFHLSALIFLLVYFIPRNKIKIKHLLLITFFFALTAIYLNTISELITQNTLKNANYYLLTQEKASNLHSFLYIGTAKRLIIVGLILLYSRQFFKISIHYYFFNIYILGLAIYVTTYLTSPDIGVRLSSYFTIFEILIAGLLVSSLSKTHNKVIVLTVLSFSAIYRIIGYANNDYYQYHSVFG